MPLSDHEKRLLDQIAQTLGSEDPGLASSLRSARPGIPTASLLVLAICGILLGLVVVLVGLRLPIGVGTVLGALGYLIIVAGTDAAVRVVGRAQRGRLARRSA